MLLGLHVTIYIVEVPKIQNNNSSHRYILLLVIPIMSSECSSQENHLGIFWIVTLLHFGNVEKCTLDNYSGETEQE